MKLNPDCVRFVLLMVEEETGPRKSLVISEDGWDIPEYSPDEIYYHVKQCHQSNLLCFREFINGEYEITDLTPAGHEFLANIRSDSVWNKTKSKAKNIGSFSLDILQKVAVSVLSEAVKAQLP